MQSSRDRSPARRTSFGQSTSLALRAKLTSLNLLVIFKSLSLLFPHLRSQAGKIYLYFVDEFLKCVIMFLNIYAC